MTRDPLSLRENTVMSRPPNIISARMFPGEDPIGRYIRIRYIHEKEPSEPWVTIVGMVGTTSSARYNHIDWNRAQQWDSKGIEIAGTDPGGRLMTATVKARPLSR
jgi:hypothetical protein